MNEWSNRTNRAQEKLSEGVVSGEFEPGQRLKAEELAAAWGISATPVREALQRLAGMGLVEAIPNRGVRVAPIEPRELREVYSLRLLLEPFALRVSLENKDESWEATVRDTYGALRASIESGLVDLVGFERVHSAFHAALLSHCDSQWMSRIIGMLNTHSVRYRLLSLGPRGGPEEVLAEHERLFDACTEGEIDAAVAELFAHIKLTVDMISGRKEGDRLTALIDSAGFREHAANLERPSQFQTPGEDQT